MKTLSAVLLVLLLAGCEKKETIADVIISDSPNDVSLKLVSTEPYQGVTNYFIATYCLSNNTDKTLDSVKVTFTGIIAPRTFSYYTVKPTEQYYPIVTYNGNTNQIKTELEWW